MLKGDNQFDSRIYPIYWRHTHKKTCTTSSSILGVKDRKTIQMPANRRTDKHNMVYPYNEIIIQQQKRDVILIYATTRKHFLDCAKLK